MNRAIVMELDEFPWFRKLVQEERRGSGGTAPTADTEFRVWGWVTIALSQLRQHLVNFMRAIVIDLFGSRLTAGALRRTASRPGLTLLGGIINFNRAIVIGQDELPWFRKLVQHQTPGI